MKRFSKKLLSIVVAVLLVVAMLCSATFTGYAAAPTYTGDVDNDGSVNAEDLSLVRKALLGETDGWYDINGDGKFNLKDLVRVKIIAVNFEKGEKFEVKYEGGALNNVDTYRLGDLFKLVDGALVDNSKVVVESESETVNAEINKADVWEDTTISFDGTGSVKIHIYEYCSATTLDVVVDYVDKFVSNGDKEISINEDYTLGYFFSQTGDREIDSSKVVFTIKGEEYALTDTADWTNSVVSFDAEGEYELTISENSKPVTVNVTVIIPDKFTVNTLGDVYVGDELTLGQIFGAVEGADIDSSNVTVTVDDEAFVLTDTIDWTQNVVKFTEEKTYTITIVENSVVATASVKVILADKFVAIDTIIDKFIGETVTLGDLFDVKDGQKVNSANVVVKVNDVVKTLENTANWEENVIELTTAGTYTIEISENSKVATATVNVKIPPVEFVSKFTNDYVYRVGNQNAVAIGSLFGTKDDAVVIGNVNVTIANSVGDAEGTYTSNATDWTKGTIQFTGTGIVDVTIEQENLGNTETLSLEVVTANNVTKYGELKNYSVTSVLLNDIEMSSNSSYYINGGATLYGNGFTFDCTKGAYTPTGSVSENYVIGLYGANLDNVRIIGAVYTEYGAMASDNYNRALVLSKQNSTITNCYISNTSSPIRIVDGSLLVKGTTVKGGNYANIDVRNGHITLEDVTTINQVNGNDLAADGTQIVGLGIVAYYENVDTSLTSITINGELKQYNYASNDLVYSNDYAQTFVDAAFDSSNSALQYEADGLKWVNTGIISMTAGVPLNDNRTDKAGYRNHNIRFYAQDGYVYTVVPNAETINSVPSEYETLGQGLIAPVYSFDYTNKNYIAKTDGSNDYCYYDNGKVLISMDQGDTFEWDPFILSATKYGNALNYTVSMNGNNYSNGSKIAFTTAGDYTVTYTYEDTYNYTVDADGNKVNVPYTYTKSVEISVSVIKPTAKHATFTFGGSNTVTENVTVNDKTYVSAKGVSETDKQWGYITVGGQKIFYPITEAAMKKNALGSEVQVYYYVFNGTVTITDYENGGTGNAVTYNASTTTMPSGLSVVNGMEAKYTSISSACVDISKLTKDGPSGEVWDFSASTTVSGTTKYNGYLAHSSPSGLSVKSGTRDYDAITVAQFSYTDAAGATYYYFVGYFMPNQVSSSGSGSGGGTCIAPETLITLADGSQVRVDSLTGEEQLLVWNLETGKYETAPIVFVDSDEEMEYEIIHLYFSDGSDVKVISEHGFFDIDLGKYVYIDANNYADYVGHKFVTQGDIATDSWNVVTLDKVVIENEVTTAWSPVTFEHLCYYTNGVLSMPGGIEGLFNIFDVDTDTMTYDAEKMQKDIETYGLFTYEDFADLIPEIAFEAFNGDFLKVAMAKGLITWEDIAYLAERYVPLV